MWNIRHKTAWKKTAGLERYQEEVQRVVRELAERTRDLVVRQLREAIQKSVANAPSDRRFLGY